jgi:hypothetical protein
MVANFFLSFSSTFDFKVYKKCFIIKLNFVFNNSILVSKIAEFDADFESVQKVAKRLMRKMLSAKK